MKVICLWNKTCLSLENFFKPSYSSSFSNLKQKVINFVDINKETFEKKHKQISFNSLVNDLCKIGKLVLFGKDQSFHCWFILIQTLNWKHVINVRRYYSIVLVSLLLNISHVLLVFFLFILNK